MGKRQILVKTYGEREGELDDLKAALMKVKDKVDGVVCGVIASEYQKHRINMVCEEVGLRVFTPLWRKQPETLLEEEIGSGFEMIITGVSSEGFDESWLGRRLDEECFGELKELSKKHGIHLAGEGGEYETFVLDCPVFKKRLKVMKYKKVWNGSSGYLKILDVKLVNKS